MNIFKYNILTLLLILGNSSLHGQISIPYGNDAILNDDTTRIDLRFELEGRDWDCRYVTYIFLNGTNDIVGDEEHEAVRRAFASWSSVTNLDFIEVCNENDADIRIAWEVGDHGDPCTIPENCFFDGEGGTLAHGFFPPPNTGAFAGDVHFDDDEDWSLDDDIDMETVALHEIGHALGLRHSEVNNSVMEAVYEGERRDLTQDDINGIRAIYGNRTHPIGGDNLICNQQTRQYTIDNFDCLNTNFTVTWTLTPNLILLSGQGTGSIEVKGNSTSSQAEITVVIDSGCDQLTYTREVWVGKPEQPSYFLLAWYDPYMERIILSVPPVPGATAYNWTVENLTFNNKSNFEIFHYEACPSNMYDIRFSVSAVNECGESPRLYGRIDRNCGFQPPKLTSPVTVYPNPSYAAYFIVARRSDGTKIKDIEETTLKGELLSIDGRIIREFELDVNGQYRFDDLTAGVYLLKMYDRKDILSIQKIIVF